MTRQEFIQEAALRLITGRPDVLMSEIAELAKTLAREIYGEELTIPKSEPDITDSIDVLIDYVDKVDLAIREERIAKYEYASCGKGGYSAALRTVLKTAERQHGMKIDTVNDLIAVGSETFLMMRGVGVKMLRAVSRALRELYGITGW